jgi:hypothetical protein
LKKILKDELVREAIDLALPSIPRMIKRFGWGPEGVVIGVSWVGRPLLPLLHVMEELGPEETWEEKWKYNFRELVLNKLSVILRAEGRATSEDILRKPWLLEEGDCLYVGAVIQDGIAVAVSGAQEETDKAIAKIVLEEIFFLCEVKALDFKGLAHV